MQSDLSSHKMHWLLGGVGHGMRTIALMHILWTETCKNRDKNGPNSHSSNSMGHTLKDGQVTVSCNNTAVVAAISDRSC